MQNMLDKGFAEILPANEIGQCPGKIWYLVHGECITHVKVN